MTRSDSHQLLLPLSGEVAPRMVRTSRAGNKKRGARLAASIPLLPMRERRFLPVAGVPKTYADCPPPSEYCPHIRCRHHLAMVDADHRAGRPGLASVPRNERGLTISVTGSAGEERAGTTFDPRWLELERRCKVWVERDEAGKMLNLHAVYENEADLFLERLHVGEAVDVMDGEYITGQEKLTRVMGARLTPSGSIALEREPDGLFTFTLVRVRGIESCALHRANRGASSNQETGDALGRHRTLIAREVRKAAEKMKAMGVDLRDLVGD